PILEPFYRRTRRTAEDQRLIPLRSSRAPVNRIGPLGRLFGQHGGDGAEVRQAGLDVFDDLLREISRLGKVFEIGEAVVLEPEEIEAALVACGQFGMGELPPAAGWVLRGVPGFLPLVPVARVVAGNEVGEVLEAQRLSFQRVMD